MAQAAPIQIGFSPWMVAGIRTQWENMRPHLSAHPAIRAHVAELHPYRAHGLLEALPFVPSVVRGNLRTLQCAGALFRAPRLDVLWTQQIRAALPYLLSAGALHRTVLVHASDSTSVQQAAFDGYYAKATGGARARLRDTLDTWCLRRAALHTPWSEWAARSLREDHGIPPARIRVLPPGIDLDRWPYLDRPARDGAPRLLFVGGDFARKGGDLLLDVFRRALQDRCELHIVTRDAVAPAPNLFVYHDLEPNDPRLRELYRRCDLFVLPTNADCFSLASMEAMATGLPVITTAVGGIPEIVAEGDSGFLIAPGDGRALVERIRLLLDAPERRRQMGARGRRIVEERFDAARNTAALLAWMQELLRGARTTGPLPRDAAQHPEHRRAAVR